MDFLKSKIIAIVVWLLRVLSALITFGKSEETLEALDLYKRAFFQTREAVNVFKDAMQDTGTLPANAWDILGDMLHAKQDTDVKLLVKYARQDIETVKKTVEKLL